MSEENKRLLNYIDRVTKYIDDEYFLKDRYNVYDILQTIHCGYDRSYTIPRTARRAVKVIRERI